MGNISRHFLGMNSLQKRKGVYDDARRDVREHEGIVWQKNQALRTQFEQSHPAFFASISLDSPEHAYERSFEVISRTLDFFDGIMNLEQVDPGHGIGHLARDYIHATVLAQRINMDPKQAYVGMIGGALHDILGCTLMPRYDEFGRVIHHAEASAYLFDTMSHIIDVPQEESVLIQYAIAAHTNSQVRGVIKGRDGIERKICPYIDTDRNQKPFMSVMLPRWTDRLDANGPCFIGRHFLTMAEDHRDDWVGDSLITFTHHMRPLLRGEEEIKADPNGATMREHIMRFLTSHSNSSFYGRFDFGEMITLREAYKDRALRIMAAFNTPLMLSTEEENTLLDEWTAWLYHHVEPSEAAQNAAEKLRDMFLDLPGDIRASWWSVMQVTLQEYKEWSQEMKQTLTSFSQERLTLPILGNVSTMI